MPNWKFFRILKVTQIEVMSVSFSSDGRYVASGSKDKTVKIWEIQTNKCLSTLQGHTSDVNSVSFSSDGRYVASGSWR